MKSLKRLLLINWLNYSFQEVDFGKITFLTGKNASGKSTLIDALQLVLLGDTNGKFFNQAANDKSGRTLTSYLYGFLSDEENSIGEKSLRSGDFTSYVVAEFLDEEKDRPFTLGFVAYCKKDRNITNRWFILHDSKIPETKFIDANNKPYNLDELKDFLNQKLKNRYDFYDTNSRYREAELFEMGELKSKYHSTLRKAVPFAPILNIADFITEYICDVKSDIDISGMQKTIRSYSDLENEARVIEEKIKELEGIRKAWNEYIDRFMMKRRFEYYLERSILEDYKNSIDKNEKEYESLEKESDEIRESIKSIEAQLDVLNKKKNLLLKDLYSNEDKNREGDLKREIDEKKRLIASINQNLDKILSFLSDNAFKIDQTIKNLKGALISDLDKYSSFSVDLNAVVRDHLPSLSLDDISSKLSAFNDDYSSLLSSYKEQVRKIGEEKERLVKEIENLRRGVKSYPEDVLKFKAECERSLERKISILADELEIKEEYREWSNIIESFLAERRFYLIVSKEEEEKCQEILSSNFLMRNVGFVRESSENNTLTHPLANAFSSENRAALNHVESLFNNLEMSMNGLVKTGEEIYTPLLETPFLGRSAILIQLERAKERLKEIIDEEDRLGRVLRAFQFSSKISLLDESRKAEFSSYIESANSLDLYLDELKALEKEYSSLDLLAINALEDEIAKLDIEIRMEGDKKTELSMRSGAIEEKKEALKTETENLSGKIVEKDKEIKEHFSETLITESEPKFIESWKEKESRDDAISVYETNKKRYETLSNNAREELFRVRQLYNNRYHMSYDISSDNNKEYQNELESLRDNQLPEHMNEIEDAKRRARDQLKNDFLSKMSDNIKSVEAQIKDFNAILGKYTFGGDSYAFTVSPSKDNRNFYDMFMDKELVLDTNMDESLFGDAFSSKYEKELDQLFSILVPERNDGKSESEKERQIAEYTDYKAYLTFDMNVKNAYGDVQKLSRNMKYKSGGETQIPFYISILVSFAQVCRMRDVKGKSTVRLVIFDEAFSKMDGERIRTCLKLLKEEFDLQVIFSAPPEKLNDVIPYTEDILVTSKSNQGARVDRYSVGDKLK